MRRQGTGGGWCAPQTGRRPTPASAIRIESLAAGSAILESQLFTLALGASSDGSYSHPGEEFMHVLEGELGVWLEPTDEFYRLEAGDLLMFPSTLAHRFRALGHGETLLIWVNSPPTF